MARLLGILLSAQGRHRKAVHAHSEAIGRYHLLEEASPGAFQVDIADIYTNLSVDLGKIGERRGGPRRAMRAGETAVRIYRDLIEGGDDHSDGLAGALNILAEALTELGRLGYAVDVVNEAVMLNRQGYAQRPDFFTDGLSDSLRRLALLLSAASSVELHTTTGFSRRQRRRYLTARPFSSGPAHAHLPA